MPRSVYPIARAVLASLPLLAAACVAAGGAGAAAPSPLLSTASLGAGYQALSATGTGVSCAAVTSGLRGAQCSQALWRLRASAVAGAMRDEALVVYELVVHTASDQAAYSLESAIDRVAGPPWRLPQYKRLYSATWALGWRIAPSRLARTHYSDWWWFRRGADFGLLVYVVEPNTVTFAFDQAVKDQATLALDRAGLGLGLGLPSPVRPAGSLLLGQSDLGPAYTPVAARAPIADCGAITGGGPGYTCSEAEWRLERGKVAQDSRVMAVVVYELVVRTPSARAAQALNDAITKAGSAPWNMPRYRSVDMATWSVADEAQPGIDKTRAATGEWWNEARGSDFVLMEFVIDGTAANQGYAMTMNDQAQAIVSEQVLTGLAAGKGG